MTPRGLSRETLLTIELGAICSRHRYTADPAAVIAELLETAGDDVEILRHAVGSWVGFYEDKYTRILCAALRELPGIDAGLAEGTHRRGLAPHTTPPLGVRHRS